MLWVDLVTVSEWGGRAMCPLDEYADLELREEMAWHALEQALTEWADGNPRALPSLGADLRDVLAAQPWTQLDIAQESTVALGDLQATWRASTDDHLGDDASGLVDLTCTLTPA